MTATTTPPILPNTFIDGLDGRTSMPGYNGEPRIKCEAGGNFEIDVASLDLIVKPNGFSIVGEPDPPDYPNGENTFLPPGSSWPPSWWPTVTSENVSVFQDGIPTEVPTWANIASPTPPTPPSPGEGEDETEYMERCMSSLMAAGVDESDAETQCQAAWDTANP
jgi:hypothetical protein